MDDQTPNLKDPIVKVTKPDLEQIRSYAIKLYADLNQQKLNFDDSQFRTYCYTMAVQAWLRARGELKIILD